MYRFGVCVCVCGVSLFVTITFLARSVGAAADHVVRSIQRCGCSQHAGCCCCSISCCMLDDHHSQVGTVTVFLL